MAPVLYGGAREVLIDFGTKFSSQTSILYGILLAIGIVFADQIPKQIINQASTLLGKVLLFLALYITVTQTTFVHGLLFVVFAGTLLNLSRYQKEGFVDEYSFRIIDSKKKWWVEEIMKENPTGIEDEKIKTTAIQDDTLQEGTSVQDTKSSIM